MAPDQFKSLVDGYGVGVRAGVITAQKDDEVAMRRIAGLPGLSADAESAWTEDGGVRRPITLQSGNAFNAAQSAVEKIDTPKGEASDE